MVAADPFTWLTVTYVVALLLEGAGIGLVVRDIQDDLTRARELRETPAPWFREPRSRAGAVQRRGPHAGIDTEAIAVQRQNVRAAQGAHSMTIAALVDILTGNMRRRAWGVGLIVAGLVFGTAGNIVSLYWTS